MIWNEAVFRESQATLDATMNIPAQIQAGDPLTLAADVTNVGAETWTVDFSFHLNDYNFCSAVGMDGIDSAKCQPGVQIAPGETVTLAVDIAPQYTENLPDGTQKISIVQEPLKEDVELASTSLDVGGGFDPNAVTVTGCGLSPRSITVGETVTFEATVENANDQDVLVEGEWSSGTFGATDRRILGPNTTRTLSASVVVDQTIRTAMGGDFSFRWITVEPAS
jgi:hypothetical protein